MEVAQVKDLGVVVQLLNFLFVWLPSVKVYCQLSNNIAKGVDYQSFFVTLHSYLG